MGTMPRRGTIALTLGVAALTATAAIAGAGTAGAADTPVNVTARGKTFTAKALPASAIRTGTKDGATDVARTDPSLLGQHGSNLVPVVVKLRYAPVASYRGNLKGLRATSPRVTGRALHRRSAAVRAYGRYIARREASFTSALAARVPGAKVGRALRIVYGGIALRVPADRVATLLRLPGVVAVQRDTLQQPRTDAVASFIGATTVTDDIGGVTGTAGEGTIFADLDTGIWPEHPSFVDHGNLAPAPAAASPRPCLFGDNPLTPAADPFVCNNKVIGGAPFLDAYHAVVGDEHFVGTARDSEGHGTHTASTAAGGPVANAPIFGIERGPLAGVAPGAHILVYKVCGPQGCFASDSAAAVAQSIVDGADVINFSIGGGDSGAPDPVDIAFLDAYNAGILVSASAGNSGPGASTVEHFWPWYMTVGASTQQRQFQSTLTVSGDAASLAIVGSSVTHGAGPLPIVNAGDVAGYDGGNLCQTAAAAGTFTGLIVVCTRGAIGRAQKGHNVAAGGAAGMVLANVAPGPTMSDNHFLPTVHVESSDGTQLQAFLVAHPNSTASFTDGVKGVGQGDRMTEFSSRGPGGLYLKPDVTAPGIQILAGNTPVPDDVAGGPEGEYFQAIAGTSMSSPVNAGAALLLSALHPSWGPGQVKSALMTTATTKVVKEDGSTPADAFDFGAGRIDLTQAGHPGLTISESAANFATHSLDPNAAIDLNIPSINAPVMPGIVKVERTVQNVSGGTLRYRTSGASGPGWRVSVEPGSFTIRPGRSLTLKVTIDGREAEVGAQVLTSIGLRQTTSRKVARSLRVPVAFIRAQGGVSLAVRCAPTAIAKGDRGACDVNVQNNTLAPAAVTSTTRLSDQLRVTGATGATQQGRRRVSASATLAGREPSTPTVAPGVGAGGFLDLALFGINPIPLGDEDVVDFTSPEPFVYGDGTATAISVSSNGWLAVGGTTAGATFIPQATPDPAEPNNTLAPFWTDLDGTNARGLLVGSVDVGVNSWLVVQWDTAVFGAAPTDPLVQMQAWIGLNGTQDISFAYDPANLPAGTPFGGDLIVGAENDDGSRGSNLGLNVAPTADLVVTSTAGTPGEVLHYRVGFKGQDRGDATVTTLVDTPSVRGTTADVQHITVRRR